LWGIGRAPRLGTFCLGLDTERGAKTWVNARRIRIAQGRNELSPQRVASINIIEPIAPDETVNARMTSESRGREGFRRNLRILPSLAGHRAGMVPRFALRNASLGRSAALIGRE
jgi:hypothetical protein